jgi:hypothetical protein
LREEAELGESSGVAEMIFTPSKEITDGYEVYVDGQKKYSGKDVDSMSSIILNAIGSTRGTSTNKQVSALDGTTANGTLPQTGVAQVVTIVTICLIVGATVILIIINKHKEIN